MSSTICIHDDEKPPRSKLGINIDDGVNYTWEKDYFCSKCNWFIGYYSRVKSITITKIISVV